MRALFPCLWRVLSAMALLAVLCIVTVPHTAAAADRCAWVFAVKEGETLSSVLSPQWDRRECPDGKYLSVSAKSGTATLPGFSIPSTHLNMVHFTPEVTGLAVGEVRYATQEISVTCDVFTPLCSTATVYYVVNGAGIQEESTTAPVPTEPIVTTTPVPTVEPVECPVGNVLPQMEVNVSLPLRIDMLAYVLHCAKPRRLAITSYTGAAADGSAVSKNVFSVNDDTLWFDREGANTMEGIFTANITVYCGDVMACSNVHVRVLAVRKSPKPSPAPPPPNCTESYGFRTSFGQTARFVIQPQQSDVCPTGSASAFTLVTPPRYNPTTVALHPLTGAFNYTAPHGPRVSSDALTFLISCESGGVLQPLCMGRVTILVTAAAPPPPRNDTKCPGNFVYTYDTSENGSFSPHLSNLFSRATASEDFCPSGVYTRAELRVPNASNGVITSFDGKTGAFVYKASKSAGMQSDTPTDHFGFKLICKTNGAVCENVATIYTRAAPPKPTDHPVYQLDRIVCRGTCDADAWRSSPMHSNVFDTTEWPSGSGTHAHVTPRRDKQSLDGMHFDTTTDGDFLRIRAYTSIGNMAARFITFAPMNGEGKGSFLTSEFLPPNAHASFDAKCLDVQAKEGLASHVWTWDDEGALRGHINTETGSYKKGENYFQKFGGKHIDCDVFREDPCKYAPMLSPSGPKTSADVGIDWKLYINDCDATWVGTISLHKLRQLHDSKGAPIFTLINESTLVGSLYTQVVKPASWVPPYKGIATLERRYTVRLNLVNSIVADVVVTPISPSGHRTSLAVQKEEEDNKKSGKAFVQEKVSEKTHEVGMVLGDRVAKSDAKNISFDVSVDVRFAAASDPVTHERLFGYALQLYPFYRNDSDVVYGVPKMNYVNATQLRVTNVTLHEASWTTPVPADCPECIGKDTTCKGTGKGLELSCSNPIISFESASAAHPIFSTLRNADDSTVGNYVSAFIVGRVRGKGAMKTGDPQGSFLIAVRFAGGQEFLLHVQQAAYIGSINTVMNSNVCRSSAYWPVPDILGRSIPTVPFNVTEMLVGFTYDMPTAGGVKAGHGPPNTVHHSDACAAWAEPHRPPFITLNGTTAILHNATTGTGDSLEKPMRAALCDVPDSNVYGVTDWAYVSFSSVHDALHESPDSTAELLSLVLSVEASEVLGVFPDVDSNTQRVSDTTAESRRLHFLLDGTTQPRGTVPELDRWMADTTDNVTAREVTYLAWEKYASFLHYRRMHVQSCRRSGARKMESMRCVMEPFHFAFVPGTLLHRRSSPRVTFHLLATLKFHSDAPGEEPQVKTLLYNIPVSASQSSGNGFALDSYTRSAVPHTTVSHGPKYATALFMLFVFLLIALFSTAIYIESYYKRSLLSAEGRKGQQLARADTVTVEGHGGFDEAALHFSPMHDPARTVELNRNLPHPDPHVEAPEGSVVTNFGAVQMEPSRIVETEEDGVEEKES